VTCGVAGATANAVRVVDAAGKANFCR
jgi:hypothetical protein